MDIHFLPGKDFADVLVAYVDESYTTYGSKAYKHITFGGYIAPTNLLDSIFS